MSKHKRTYGTGTCIYTSGKQWRLFYRPRWALKPISKRVEVATEGKCKAACKEAEALLAEWVKQLDRQEGAQGSVTISDLHKLHVADMELDNCTPEYLRIVTWTFRKHVMPYFNSRDLAADPIKKADIKKYKAHRYRQGARGSTINRELAMIHRMLVLGNDEEKFQVAIPLFEKFDEKKYIRTGRITDEQYYAILRSLPRHSQAVWCLAYRTGVRKGELLKLRAEWLLPHWNKPEPYIEIPGFDQEGNRVTKSGKPHVIPLWHPEMRALLEMTLADRNPKCPYLFQHRGKQLKSIREGFAAARREAGLDGTQVGVGKVIFHDTRRSAATHMDEIGIDKESAKEMTGHLTDAMWERYRIGKASQAVKTGQKLRAFQEQQNPKFTPEFTPATPLEAASAGGKDVVN